MALLPLTLVMLAFSARSGALSARIGPRLQMTVGPLIVGAGLVLLTRATNPGSYWTQVFPAVLLFAVGLAVTVAPLTSTAMGAAPAEHSGVASAVNNVVARAAGLLAVAVLPAPGRPDRGGRAGAARNWPRVPHRHADLGRRLRRRRRAGGADHPQPGPHAGRRRPRPRSEEPTWYCGVSGPPLNPSLAAAAGTRALRPTCGQPRPSAKVGPMPRQRTHGAPSRPSSPRPPSGR